MPRQGASRAGEEHAAAREMIRFAPSHPLPSNFFAMSISVTVKLFAAYQDAYGQSELTLELPAGATVAAVCDRLLTDHPELEQWRDLTRFGVNLQFVEPDTVLRSGDEVVLIPPVSGG